MVSSDRSKVVLAAAAIPALLLGVLLLWQWRSTACTFQEVAPGVYLCRQRHGGYQLQTALINVQAKEGLWPWRRLVGHWVLVDAGVPDSWLSGGHASSLFKALRRKLRPARRGEPAGQLDLVLLTHAHPTGALPKLLQAYPGAKVAAHADELPALQQQGLPPDRLLPLLGEGADLVDAAKAAGGAVKKALHWMPRGELSFVKVAGHTPGSIALIHTPSGTLLAGDAVTPRKGWMGRAAPSTGFSAPPHSNASTAALQAAAKSFILQDRQWEWLLPLHGGNYSRQQARALVISWPDESEKPAAAREEETQQHKAGAPVGTDDSQAEDFATISMHDTAAAGLGLSASGGQPPSEHASSHATGVGASEL